jgi:hypothetical protein
MAENEVFFAEQTPDTLELAKPQDLENIYKARAVEIIYSCCPSPRCARPSPREGEDSSEQVGEFSH